LFVIAGVMLITVPSSAQFQNGSQSIILTLPEISQHSVLTQRIGITDITINYHRPLVNGRKVFGGIVPYGQVWRAGANQNTTITFTDPVTIEGKPLAKGTYGLHMIPGESEWTVIFSNNYTSWGSFSYDQKEDALRVTVKPQLSEFHEALAYDFDDMKPDSAQVTLRWEKVAVLFHVGVNVNEIVGQSIKNELRNTGGFTWMGFDDAATYLLENKGDLKQALNYADQAIQNEERFDDLLTKSRILDAMGKKDEATTARNKALGLANVIQTHTYARQLQREGKSEEAYKLFRENARKNPDSWVVHVGLSRMYSAQGDFPSASKEMTTAIAGAPDGAKGGLQGLAKRLENKDDINK
jgi:tetratricopeptide (TPR) repeat protein